MSETLKQDIRISIAKSSSVENPVQFSKVSEKKDAEEDRAVLVGAGKGYFLRASRSLKIWAIFEAK